MHSKIIAVYGRELVKKLALWGVIARVIDQGLRLSAVRFVANTAVDMDAQGH